MVCWVAHWGLMWAVGQVEEETVHSTALRTWCHTDWCALEQAVVMPDASPVPRMLLWGHLGYSAQAQYQWGFNTAIHCCPTLAKIYFACSVTHWTLGLTHTRQCKCSTMSYILLFSRNCSGWLEVAILLPQPHEYLGSGQLAPQDSSEDILFSGSNEL